MELAGCLNILSTTRDLGWAGGRGPHRPFLRVGSSHPWGANTLLLSPASSALYQEPAQTHGGCLKGDPSFSVKFSGFPFQTPPGSQASPRGEAEDSTFLSSRDTDLWALMLEFKEVQEGHL